MVRPCSPLQGVFHLACHRRRDLRQLALLGSTLQAAAVSGRPQLQAPLRRSLRRSFRGQCCSQTRRVLRLRLPTPFGWPRHLCTMADVDAEKCRRVQFQYCPCIIHHCCAALSEALQAGVLPLLSVFSRMLWMMLGIGDDPSTIPQKNDPTCCLPAGL